MAALNRPILPIVAPTPTDRLLPFEKALLEAVASALQPPEAGLLTQQLACINSVRRPLDWKLIEFHCKRWFLVRWPREVLFARRDNFRIATITCQFGMNETHAELWAADGHVQALQSTLGFSGLSISGALRVISVDINTQKHL